MDRKKTIEEMMIDCQCTEKNTLSLRCRGKDCDTCRLEKLIDAGYRKVPEDAVVLTQEMAYEYRADVAKVKFLKDEIRKEAAREIFSAINKYSGRCFEMTDNGVGTFNYYKFFKWLTEFGEQFNEKMDNKKKIKRRK